MVVDELVPLHVVTEQRVVVTVVVAIVSKKVRGAGIHWLCFHNSYNKSQ